MDPIDKDIDICIVCSRIIKGDTFACDTCTIKIDETSHDSEMNKCPTCNNEGEFVGNIDNIGNLRDMYDKVLGIIYDNSGNVLKVNKSITDASGIVHDL